MMAPTSGEEMVVRLLAENSYDFFFFFLVTFENLHFDLSFQRF